MVRGVPGDAKACQARLGQQRRHVPGLVLADLQQQPAALPQQGRPMPENGPVKVQPIAAAVQREKSDAYMANPS